MPKKTFQGAATTSPREVQCEIVSPPGFPDLEHAMAVGRTHRNANNPPGKMNVPINLSISRHVADFHKRTTPTIQPIPSGSAPPRKINQGIRASDDRLATPSSISNNSLLNNSSFQYSPGEYEDCPQDK
jgi:hypothetical protein